MHYSTSHTRALSSAEKSFVTAIRAGCNWTAKFHEAWQTVTGEPAASPENFTIDANLLNALLRSEAAKNLGIEQRQCDRDRLKEFGLTGSQPFIAGGLVIDWTSQSYLKEFNYSSTYRTDLIPFFSDKTERRTQQHPRIIGSLDLDFLNVPFSIAIRGCIFTSRANQSGFGDIRAESAHLRDLDLSGSQFRKLIAPNADIDGQAQFNGVQASQLRLQGSTIKGNLSAMGAEIFTTEQRALDCGRIHVFGSVFLTRGFKANRRVCFYRSTIGSNFRLHEAEILLPPLREPSFENVDEFCALDLDTTVISGGLLFDHSWGVHQRRPAKIRGHIDLTNAQCKALSDAPLISDGFDPWLDPDSALLLDGFTYEGFGPLAPISIEDRTAWLDRQFPERLDGKDFRPQPFEQVARALQKMGYADASRGISQEMERRHHRQRRASGPPSTFKAWWRRGLWWISWFVRLVAFRLTAYGYRTDRAAWIGLIIMIAATPVVGTAYRMGYMTPAQPHAALSTIMTQMGTNNGEVKDCLIADHLEAVPPFHAWAYVVDTFIPLVDLDQETSWKPSQEPRCEGNIDALKKLDEINPGLWSVPDESSWLTRSMGWLAKIGALHWLQWLLTASGFTISGLIAASASGLIRRD